MKQFSNTLNRLKAFKRSERGSLSVDALLILPMLLWTMMMTFTYFEGFRQSASSLKAAYTISDLVSRETKTITSTYVDSLQVLLTRMVQNTTLVRMRLTVVVYDSDQDRHFVQWSTVRGFENEWTDDNIGDLRDKLPPMPDRDTLIIVETSNTYEPVFPAGISDTVTFENFVFTRPRFTNEVAASV